MNTIFFLLALCALNCSAVERDALFRIAAKNGDFSHVKQSLVSDSMINQSDKNTALYFALEGAVKRNEVRTYNPNNIDYISLFNDSIKTVALLLQYGANPNAQLPNEVLSNLMKAVYYSDSISVEVLLIYGADTLNSNNVYRYFPLDYAKFMLKNCRNISRQKKIIKLLSLHIDLQKQVLAPNNKYFENIIENNFIGLVKQSMKNGFKPRIADLVLAKSTYEKNKSEAIKLENDDELIKEINLRTSQEIGKKLIQYLRLTDGTGCYTYPPIYKYGLKSLFPEMPHDVVNQIAWWVVN